MQTYDAINNKWKRESNFLLVFKIQVTSEKMCKTLKYNS